MPSRPKLALACLLNFLQIYIIYLYKFQIIMTGRHPLQSTANLPVKPSSANQPRPDGFTKPSSRPLPSRPQPHPSASSRPQPPPARPGMVSSAGTRAPTSSSGSKPSKPGGPPTSSSSSRPQPESQHSGSKPAQSSSGLGATATFGKAAGDKQHRWKLDDFDIGRPLGKVRIEQR